MNRKIAITITLICILFPEFLAADINDAEYWLQKGLRTQDLKSRIEFFNRALKLDPQNVNAHNSLGVVYIRKGLFDLAISHLRTAVKIDRNFLDAHINLAIATRCKGDPKKSIQIYDQVLAADPNSVVALYNQAIAFEKTKNYQNAIQNYLKAISFEPDNRKILLNLGVAYFRQGQEERGIQVLQTLVESFPDYAKAHYDLGVIFQNLKRWSDAKYHFQAASDLGMNVPGKYLGKKSSESQQQKPSYTKWIPPTPVPAPIQEYPPAETQPLDNPVVKPVNTDSG